jgi:hypothetical protein
VPLWSVAMRARADLGSDAEAQMGMESNAHDDSSQIHPDGYLLSALQCSARQLSSRGSAGIASAGRAGGPGPPEGADEEAK